jgi:ectoine hydroxylase-related dioxygenase (phytanoyl-CoA dioxygenase family)|eukprot:COSAG01_NODE_141_length_24253_cov_36.101130_19_plen_412_part_00
MSRSTERLSCIGCHLSTSPTYRYRAAPLPVGAAGVAAAGTTAQQLQLHDNKEQQSSFPSASQRAHFELYGYCVVDDAVQPALVAELRAASRRVRDRVHAGGLRHGFIHRNAAGEPWGIRGLLSPQHAEPAFADYIGCAELMKYVQGFTQSAALGLGSLTLFTQPRDSAFTIGWHRDSSTPGGSKTYGGADYSESAERRAWEREQWANRSPWAPKTPEARGAVGFQLALLDSSAFELVPGSHRRWRTAEEFESMSHYKGKYAREGAGPNFGLTKFSELPNMLAVPLRAGQTMFWDGDLIHRGSMLPDIERLTLHCSMGRRRLGPASKEDPKKKSPPPPPGGPSPPYSDWRLMWRTHPDVRAALPRLWQREAWDEWAASQSVPAGVAAWHQRRGPECEQIDFADAVARAAFLE